MKRIRIHVDDNQEKVGPNLTWYLWPKGRLSNLAADPSSAGIAKAVDERTLEFRRFQTHKEELAHEFYSEGFARVIPLARQYHERRVAFFVINGWTDAIQICIHNVLEEGGH